MYRQTSSQRRGAVVTRPADQPGVQVQPQRWKVERTVGWFNRCRVLSKDDEVYANTSAPWVYIASLHVLQRRLSRRPQPASRAPD